MVEIVFILHSILLLLGVVTILIPSWAVSFDKRCWSALPFSRPWGHNDGTQRLLYRFLGVLWFLQAMIYFYR
jgi:hypothetical protein